MSKSKVSLDIRIGQMIQIETTLFNNIKARNETGKTVKNYKTFGLNLFEIIVQEKDIIENQRE